MSGSKEGPRAHNARGGNQTQATQRESTCDTSTDGKGAHGGQGRGVVTANGDGAPPGEREHLKASPDEDRTTVTQGSADLHTCSG